MSLIGNLFKVEFSSESDSKIGGICYLSETELLLNVLDNEYGSWIVSLDKGSDVDLEYAIKLLSEDPNLAFFDTPTADGAMLSNTGVAEFHPRIWRGIYSQDIFECISPVAPSILYGSAYIQSIVAADSLFKSVEELFRFYEPRQSNNGAFGHRSRELIILICTEIENSWRYILKENSTNHDNNHRYTTKDYVKLLEPMKLSEWSLSLSDYPEYPKFAPFDKWDAETPTKSIAWYDAYNSIKHDREGTFEKATFECLLNAASALHIMLCAQWGPENLRHSLFDVTGWPKFKINEHYTQPLKDGGWIKKEYFD